MTFPEQSGQPSPIFGDRFPRPFDGKQIMFDIARRFTAEFNQSAIEYLDSLGGEARSQQWSPLTVTSAYPTSRQHCPRISVIRTGSSPKIVGLGSEIETIKATTEAGDVFYRSYRGQTITDNIEVSVSSLNERLRDDMFTWFQQYCIDAIGWLLPQLSYSGGVYDISCVNAIDDQVEYQGNTNNPGFEFYVAKMDFRVQYDLVVVRDVDTLREIVNWQSVVIP